FAVGQFGLLIGSAAIVCLVAVVYYLYPNMFGRMMDTKLRYLYFWITFICAYLVLFPMHFMRIDAVPRRYYTFTAFPFMDNWFSVNLLITWAAIVAALAQVAFLWNFFASI